MKQLLTLLLCTLTVPLAPVHAAPGIGDQAPAWQYLQGADGKLHSLSDYKDAQVVVVVFLCNKCPCARGYDSRFGRFVEQYAAHGVTMVGINANMGPIETVSDMKKRAVAGGYTFDYLRDASQKVARGFGARSTPHAFVLDRNRRIVYSGAFDSNRNESQVTDHYVIDAVNALLKGQNVAVSTSQQFGCAINYQ